MSWIFYLCTVFFKCNFSIHCLICDKNFDAEVLKIHCQFYHLVNENDYFFCEELFSLENNSKICDECQIQFKNCRRKKNHNFLFHKNQQTEGTTNQQLPVNILKRDPITYYSNNFYQQKNFYDFFDQKIFDRFFNSIQEYFFSARGKEFKM